MPVTFDTCLVGSQRPTQKELGKRNQCANINVGLDYRIPVHFVTIFSSLYDDTK
jgi:hypothetical protein